jgi:hypothetical protein
LAVFILFAWNNTADTISITSAEYVKEQRAIDNARNYTSFTIAYSAVIAVNTCRASSDKMVICLSTGEFPESAVHVMSVSTSEQQVDKKSV